ncbi:MAG: AAA family ATPase [Bacteroidota bacterium]|nr:AAA family ATPase [Bacteroidota bacterium]
MEELFSKSNALISGVQTKMIRNAPQGINYQWRLNGLLGSRGTGKTTRMLQELKMLQGKGHKVLYVTLDDFYFAKKTPVDLANEFTAIGGEYLYFDEVHKLPNWSIFLKNIYDFEPRINVLFSGSSLIQIDHKGADLSRRALMYKMPGLSFREYLFLKHQIHFEPLSLETIAKNHREISSEILQKCRPIQYFKEYLKTGYYPFFLEKNRNYQVSLSQIIKYILEVDFNTITGYQGGQYYKLMDILLTVAQNPPFDFNVTRVAQSVGINRNTLVNYLHYLNKSELITHINYPQTSMSNLTKPDKMLLSNPNLYDTLVGAKTDIGSLRESFFVNQIKFENEIFLDKDVDYKTGDYRFEIGGKNKKVIKGENIFTVKDDIEIGAENTIPLYLFGFLY